MESHQCADIIIPSYGDQTGDHYHLNNVGHPVQQILLETAWTHIYPIDFVHLNDFLNKDESSWDHSKVSGENEVPLGYFYTWSQGTNTCTTA